MAVSLWVAGAHDLDPNIILDFSILFYFVVILVLPAGASLLHWNGRRAVK